MCQIVDFGPTFKIDIFHLSEAHMEHKDIMFIVERYAHFIDGHLRRRSTEVFGVLLNKRTSAKYRFFKRNSGSGA